MTKKNNKTEEVLDIVTYMKDNMVTQTEFKKTIDEVKEKITAVEHALVNRFDNELEKRGQLEARVTRLEKVQK